MDQSRISDMGTTFFIIVVIIYDESRTCINLVEFTSIAFYRMLFFVLFSLF